MPDLPTCRTADFFVLRTPGLPLDALSSRNQTWEEADAEDPSSIRLERGRDALRQILRELVRRDTVREALALASPDLASRLGAWLEGSLETTAARNVERALVKYLSRMSSRATPFGLFAGVSMGAWGATSHLAVGPWLDCRKAMRLDWGVLETLVDGLAREPEVRALMVYRPNSSLYARGGWYRYLERREPAGGQGRTYHLEAVEATPHFEFVLQQAQEGARLEDLATSLARHMKVELMEAQAFLARLVDAQVLCGDLQPPLTSPDPLGQVIRALQAHAVTAPRAAPLMALDLALKPSRARPWVPIPGAMAAGWCHWPTWGLHPIPGMSSRRISSVRRRTWPCPRRFVEPWRRGPTRSVGSHRHPPRAPWIGSGRLSWKGTARGGCRFWRCWMKRAAWGSMGERPWIPRCWRACPFQPRPRPARCLAATSFFWRTSPDGREPSPGP